MPSYISRAGEWFPAEEKVAIVNAKGEPEIYQGKDRAALAAIAAGDITSQPFWKDVEWVNRVRQLHNMSMDEFMKSNNFDEKSTAAQFEEKMKVVNLHKDPVKKPGNKFRSGGANTAAGGGGSISGDFGDLADAKAKVK